MRRCSGVPPSTSIRPSIPFQRSRAASQTSPKRFPSSSRPNVTRACLASIFDTAACTPTVPPRPKRSSSVPPFRSSSTVKSRSKRSRNHVLSAA